VLMFGWMFSFTDLIAHKGAATVVPFPVVIAVIAGFGWWLSSHAMRRGWIA
jgi:hypothetical protein